MGTSGGLAKAISALSLGADDYRQHIALTAGKRRCVFHSDDGRISECSRQGLRNVHLLGGSRDDDAISNRHTDRWSFVVYWINAARIWNPNPATLLKRLSQFD